MRLESTEYTSYLYDYTTDVDAKKNFDIWLKDKEILDDNNTINISKLLNKKGVTDIGKNAFCFENDLISVILPSTIKNIDDTAFARCKNLEEIQFKDGIVKIGSMAFSECKNLRNIKLPDTVQELGYYIFSYNTNLSSIILSQNLKILRKSEFEDCTNLTTITIPKSVNNIEVDLNGDWTNSVFKGCTNLTEVNIDQGSSLLVNNQPTSELAQKLGVIIDKIHVK